MPLLVLMTTELLTGYIEVWAPQKLWNGAFDKKGTEVRGGDEWEQCIHMSPISVRGLDIIEGVVEWDMFSL